MRYREKARIIDDIYSSYIERDIGYLLKIKKIEAFNNLIKILASQIGKLINYSELSSSLGISIKTVKNYIWYAEKTFIIQRVSPYFQNVRKEITEVIPIEVKFKSLSNTQISRSLRSYIKRYHPKEAWIINLYI